MQHARSTICDTVFILRGRLPAYGGLRGVVLRTPLL